MAVRRCNDDSAAVPWREEATGSLWIRARFGVYESTLFGDIPSRGTAVCGGLPRGCQSPIALHGLFGTGILKGAAARREGDEVRRAADPSEGIAEERLRAVVLTLNELA